MPADLETRLDSLFACKRAGGGNLAIRDDFFTLLARLGNPHKRLPPVIHVAGTNGKGSTIAFMRAMLEAAGHRVHAYTSPHLLRYHERFMIAGNIIDDAGLVEGLDAIDAVMDGLDLSFLEITPALGFYLFAKHSADILLLETGLGGRLDHTNILENPLVTVITTLSLDHTHLLGETIEQIAFEKAGIMKPGMPCVVGHQIFDAARPVLRDHAEKTGSSLIEIMDIPKLPPLGLAGDHQRWNAAAAIAALRAQDVFNVPESAIKTGLATVSWPGRLQHIAVPGLLPGWDFYFDGAHNDSGAMVLADWIRAQDRPVHLLAAMRADKNPDDFIRLLTPVVASLTPLSGCDGMINSDHFSTLCTAHHPAHLFPPAPMARAIQNIQSNTPTPAIILCAGSLYLAQHAISVTVY